jgi:hypothetical protein
MRRNGLVSRSALAVRPSVFLLLLRTSMCCVVTPSRQGAAPYHGAAISFRPWERPALYSYPGAFPGIQAVSLAIARW